jgi:hypothetical protein
LAVIRESPGKEKYMESNPAFTGMIVGLIAAVVFLCVGLTIAAMRNGASTMYQRPGRIQYFAAWGTPDVILKLIIRFAQMGGYRIDAIDEAGGRIVLSDSASLTSWGFFYPVFLSYQGNGQTVIEVGIKSKFMSMGPIVSRHHDKCFNGIRGAILAGG